MIRSGVVRLLVLASVMSTLVLVGGASPADATEPPPSFITAWGSLGTGDGQFNNPYGIAVDSERATVFVADANMSRVEKFDLDGNYLGQWGSQGGGAGELNGETGLAVDADGDVYVADTGNSRIQQFGPDGTYLGGWGRPGGAPGEFLYPYSVAVNHDTGDVYVTDTGNNRIERFTAGGTYLGAWPSYAISVAIDPITGDVYATEPGYDRVLRYTASGVVITQWQIGDGSGNYFDPWGVAVDGDGHVYVTDERFNRVQEFDGTGTLITEWGSAGAAEGQFSGVHAVAVDRHENLYVVDGYNHRVQKFGDLTDPTVDLVAPPDGAAYPLDQIVDAEYFCADNAGGSGIAAVDGCVGTVVDGSPIDTSALGDHLFTVTATDVAGNTSEVTHAYTVADPRPDARIRKGATGVFKGDGVYNATGAGQTVQGAAARGSTITYWVSAQNDAPFADALRLKGTATTTRFRVTYTAGGVDITPQVVAGTYTTPVLAPGDAVLIKVVVKVKVTAPAGSVLTGSMVVKSDADPARRDTVKFVTSRA